MHETGNGIIVIEKGDSAYPQLLREIPSAPERLWCKGDTALLQQPMAAVVGSRKCSEYGKQVAMNLGKTLAQAGAVVVSGMAKGIDSFGHLGALKAGGKTIAVLGCGVDICYPAENRKLYEQIISEGLVISEYEPGTGPKPYMFPQRNRIIAGLSDGILVTEARKKSGTLITVSFGLEFGKNIYAVPGRIDDVLSEGCNYLLKEGAKPVTCGRDLLEDINLDMGNKKT